MTKEEAKKMGATHYLELGIYASDIPILSYYVIFRNKLFVLDCGVWIESDYLPNQLPLQPL